MNKYRSVKQYDTLDCAIACIASLSWYYGKRISLTVLQQYTDMSTEGASVSDIIVICEKIGLNAEAAKKTEAFNENELPCPCIAHVILENGMGHYIVIYKVGKKNILISDPALGLITVDKNDFLASRYSEKSPYIWSGILIFITPSENFKRKDFREKKDHIFLKIILSEKNIAAYIIMLSLISMILSMVGAFYFKVLLDFVIPNRWGYTLIFVSLIFIMMRTISILIDKVRVEQCLKLSKIINLKLSLEYYKQILNIPIPFLAAKKNGDFISRLQDVSKVEEVLVTSILVVPIDIVLIISLSVVLCMKSVKIFSMVLLLCFGYFIIVCFYKNSYIINNSRQMSAKARTMSHIIESLEGIETIKKFCQEKHFYNSGKEKFINWQNLLVTLGKIENNQVAVKKIISGLGEIIIICLGSLEVIKGNLTIGDLITYNILIGYLLSPINDIIYLQPQFHAAQVAVERLNTIMKQSQEHSEGATLEDFVQLEMKNLNAEFEKDVSVLQNINFKIFAGEKVAIIGRSGAGKTTFAKLIIKLYSPNSGDIHINGINILKINGNSIRQKIIYISEEDFIFTGSIKENLTLGETVSEKKMIDIAKKMGVHDFVKEFPRQYESILVEGGKNLSKGQRQKIAIARAVLREPQVLILDEATSNMDYISENRIMNVLKNNRKLTLIVISHRLDNIIDSDCIYMMENGHIVAKGNHDELTENCMIYKTFFE